jgi:prevent-host-death family protein
MTKRQAQAASVAARGASAPATPATRTSTDVQNRFGGVLEELRALGTIVIERHERPAAVLLTVEEYARLQASAPPAQQLDALTVEFDALVARMQSPSASAGLLRAFSASPAELSTAAAAGIRQSKRAASRAASRRA